MRLLVDAALSVLFSPECAACAAPLAQPTRGAVCEHCWMSVVPVTPPFCDCCGDALRDAPMASARCPRCRQHPPAIERARSLGLYDGALRQIVHALKYGGRRSVAGPIGRRLRQGHADLLELADIAVPVPLHPSKQRERGFNQAEDLARAIGLPVTRALRRLRRTARQTDLNAEERLENVRDAFAVTRHAARVRGRSVVLVDDVTTTGATLNACAAALLEADVTVVYALTAARAATKSR
ncbi:MAG: ComF family protein [Vicinamibacterales bacterium]